MGLRRRSLESGVWIWELGPRGVKSKFTDLLIFFKISLGIYQSVNQSVNKLLVFLKISVGIYQSVIFCIGNLTEEEGKEEQQEEESGSGSLGPEE